MAKEKGSYCVPDEIRALKPAGIPCLVKNIRGHFYVYEHKRVQDPARPGKTKNASGRCIGKIEGGVFVPNGKDDRVGVNPASLKDRDLENKDYGEYAVVLACSGCVLDKLKLCFSEEDSARMYAMGIIYFIHGYRPASYIKDIFDQSVLSDKWRTLPFSENTIGSFLKEIGLHGLSCEKFEQTLIEESSEMTAIDGHVILSCSQQNDLADYGRKYSVIGNKQVNIMTAYDVEQDHPLTSKVFDGALPDKSAVRELFDSYNFKNKTFIVDMGFYSEENLGIYRKGGNHFVIPVPDNTVIARAMKVSAVFSDSFLYERAGDGGVPEQDVILYRESTVNVLEQLVQWAADEDARKKNETDDGSANTEKKPGRHRARKINKSQWGEDRIIIYRDETMHRKMADDFKSQIGIDEQHTPGRLAELEDFFGVILLQTNKQETAQETYSTYKKRWRIETHYNHVRNEADFTGIQSHDYYTLQGIGFMMLIEGLIKASFQKKLENASSDYVRHMSKRECLQKAAHAKIALHQDGLWYPSTIKSRTEQMLVEMGVTVEDDINKLNNKTY